LVHLCTCKAAANRSNVCKAAANRSNVNVSGKKINNKILLIPETMQGISTCAESKEERRKKKQW
jgi:hypothetical protein